MKRLIPSIRLALIGAAVAGVLAGVDAVTHRRIDANEQRSITQALTDVTGDLRVGQLTGSLTPPLTICTASGTPLYRVRQIEARGYGGAINILIGVDAADRVTGVRVISHHETHGIGDIVDVNKSIWIRAFTGLLASTAPALALRGDGGAFDGVTGATITTRAVVSGVRDMLIDIHDPPSPRCTHVLPD